MTEFDKLASVVSTPSHFGDSIRITFLKDGGLSLEPLDDNHPGIVLDPDQTEDLRQRLYMDPEVLQQIVADRILRERMPVPGGEVRIPGPLLLMLASVMGLAFYGLFMLIFSFI